MVFKLSKQTKEDEKAQKIVELLNCATMMEKSDFLKKYGKETYHAISEIVSNLKSNDNYNYLALDKREFFLKKTACGLYLLKANGKENQNAEYCNSLSNGQKIYKYADGNYFFHNNEKTKIEVLN